MSVYSSTGAPLEYDEKKVRAVSCPHCGAKSGARCVTNKEKIIGYGFHMRRKAVVYPRFGQNKKGLAPPCFDVEPVRCARCNETGLTAPHRAPFRGDIDPPGCAVCIEEVWAEAARTTRTVPKLPAGPLRAVTG